MYGLTSFNPTYRVCLARREQDQAEAAEHIELCRKRPTSEMNNCKHVIYSYNMNVVSTAVFDTIAIIYGTGTSTIREYTKRDYDDSPSWFCGTICTMFITTVSSSSLAVILVLASLLCVMVVGVVVTCVCVRKCNRAALEIEQTPPAYFLTEIKKEL